MPRYSSTLNTISKNALTVAASNSPADLINSADYVCDGVADEVQINLAIVASGLRGAAGNPGSEVFLYPGDFTLAAPIAMNVNRTTLRSSGNRSSNTCTLNGLAGTSCILITADGCALYGLDIATAQDGIEVDGTASGGINTLTVRDCYVRNHSRYGMYFHNGNWGISISDSNFWNNATAGIYCVSTTADNSNGLGFNLVGCSFVGSGAAKLLVWNGVALNVTGCLFELGAIGIEIGGNNEHQPIGASIVGCYFEPFFTTAAIRIGDNGTGTPGVPAPNTVGASGIFISGNYMSGPGVDMIVLSEMTSGVILNNAYIGAGDLTGAQIRSSTVGASCLIMYPTGSTSPVASSFGSAKVIGSASNQVGLNGDSMQSGISWSAGAARSANLQGTSPTGYFHLNVRPNEYITSIRIRPISDAANTSTVSLQRILVANSGGAWADVTTPEVFSGGGTFTHTVSHRVEDDYLYRFAVVVNGSVGGTYYYLYSPRMVLI